MKELYVPNSDSMYLIAITLLEESINPRIERTWI